MRTIHRQQRVQGRKGEVVDPEFHCQVLQFAVAVGHADRAHVVAFGQQQFDDLAAVPVEPRRAGAHLHAFPDGGNAGGQQFAVAGHLHQA